RSDRLRRTRRPAPGARAHGPGLPRHPAVLPAARADPAARRGRRRTTRRASRGARGRDPRRRRRGPGPGRRRPPGEVVGAVMTTPTLTRSPARPAAPVRWRPPRSRRLTAMLSLAVLALVWAHLAVGNDMSPGEILATLTGRGDGQFTIFRLRLPAAALGAAVGAAFGVAGGLFQTVLRNPLASPDILGVSGGASLAAATGILVLSLGGAAISLAALVGAFAAAVAIYVLAWRDGVSGYRFVLIGVGVAFAVQAALAYLVSRADVNDVREALVWMVGSLGTPDWSEVGLL